MEAMCVESKTICPILKGCKLGYFSFFFFFLLKGTRTQRLLWQQYSRCHSVSYVMYIFGAKLNLKSSAPIFLKILLIQYFAV